MAHNEDRSDAAGQHSVRHRGDVPALRVASWLVLACAGVYVVVWCGHCKCMGTARRDSSIGSPGSANCDAIIGMRSVLQCCLMVASTTAAMPRSDVAAPPHHNAGAPF